MLRRLTIGKADPWNAAVALPLSKGGSHTPALRRCLSAHFLRIYSVNPSVQNAHCNKTYFTEDLQHFGRGLLPPAPLSKYPKNQSPKTWHGVVSDEDG